jgi:hypothetical protein
MCPLCITTAVLLAVGATTTGGLAAFAFSKLGSKHSTTTPPSSTQSKEYHHG